MNLSGPTAQLAARLTADPGPGVESCHITFVEIDHEIISKGGRQYLLRIT